MNNQFSRISTLFLLVFLFVLSSCRKDEEGVFDPADPKVAKITMVTAKESGSDFLISIAGLNGIEFSVDWGDGEKVEYTKPGPEVFNLNEKLKGNTVKIYSKSTSDISGIVSTANKLSKVDIRNATGISDVYFNQNDLADLDVSRNSNLKNLDVSGNQIKQQAMNVIMNQVPVRSVGDNATVWVRRSAYEGQERNDDPSVEARESAEQKNWDVRSL